MNFFFLWVLFPILTNGFIRSRIPFGNSRQRIEKSFVYDYVFPSKQMPDKRPLSLIILQSKLPSETHDETKMKPCTDPLPMTLDLKEMIRMSRLNDNILSVSLLSVVSGLAVRPRAWTEWIHSPPFLAATLMLHLMTSASMILNDIQDYEVDCINNPQRPLVMGTVTEKDANVAVITLFSMYTYLALQYLPPVLDPIWSSALIMITIYTPLLKKICFVKNLACASTIASSVPFVGWSVINPLETGLPDFHWLLLTTRIVFTTSLFIEMMLDITDKDGDKASGIPTVPVVFGEPTTIGILIGIVSTSLWISMTESRDPAELGMILVTYLPLYFHMYRVDKDAYRKDTILNVVKLTTVQLGAYLIMMVSHQ